MRIHAPDPACRSALTINAAMFLLMVFPEHCAEASARLLITINQMKAHEKRRFGTNPDKVTVGDDR